MQVLQRGDMHPGCIWRIRIRRLRMFSHVFAAAFCGENMVYSHVFACFRMFSHVFACFRFLVSCVRVQVAGHVAWLSDGCGWVWFGLGVLCKY